MPAILVNNHEGHALKMMEPKSPTLGLSANPGVKKGPFSVNPSCQSMLGLFFLGLTPSQWDCNFLIFGNWLELDSSLFLRFGLVGRDIFSRIPQSVFSRSGFFLMLGPHPGGGSGC